MRSILAQKRGKYAEIMKKEKMRENAMIQKYAGKCGPHHPLQFTASLNVPMKWYAQGGHGLGAEDVEDGGKR